VSTEEGKQVERVLYEDEVSDLKDADKTRRWGRAALYFLLNIGLLFMLYVLLGLIGLLVGMFLLIFLFPSPFITAPNWYKVTTEGLVLEKGMVRLKEGLNLRFKVHRNRNYIAVLRKNREIMWLYAHNVDSLIEALNEISLAKS